MGIDEQFRIDKVHSTESTPGTPDVQKGDQAEFRRLLDKLEQVAKDSESSAKVGDVADVVDADKGEPTDDLRKLNDAFAEADDEFQNLMDLRRRLEEAYRRTQG